MLDATPDNIQQTMPERPFWPNVIADVEEWLEFERDRLPLLIPVGLAAGVTCWQLWGEALAIAFYGSCAGLALIGLALGVQRRLGALLAIGSLLFASGFAVISMKSAIFGAEPLSRPWIGELHARIVSVEHVSARNIVRLTLDTARAQAFPRRIRVNLEKAKYQPAYKSGAIIKAKVRLMPPPPPALPRSYDFARTAWFAGLGATGSVLGQPQLIGQASGSGNFWDERRNQLSAHIQSAMPGNSGAVGAALLIGSRGAISEKDAEALRNSGMAHLLSVSGLHVTAVVGGCFLLVSRLLSLFGWFALRFRVPIAAAASAAMVAVGYTLLTGAEVPTVRACVAALLILVAMAMGRDALSLRLLAAGACFVLLFWPESLAGPSFQLSFSAVATIIILHESPSIRKWTARREEGFVARGGRFLLSLLLTGVAIELVLAPIALFHFHKSGLYGAAANIIAIPLTTFLIMPAQILGLMTDAVSNGLGAPFWWLAGQGVSAILSMAHYVSAAPGAVAMLPSMPRWAFGMIVTGGLMIAVFQTRWRWLALMPMTVCLIAILTAPRPDLLVTGDGRHMAISDEAGNLALLRPRAGDYAVDMLTENAAVKSEPVDIARWPGAKCNSDMCIVQIERAGRSWLILATRSPYRLPSMELAAACRRVDIVISDRFLPFSCKPRWFKADRRFLEQSGGLAVYLADGRIDSVAATTAHQPWSPHSRSAETPSRWREEQLPENPNNAPEQLPARPRAGPVQ